MFLSALNEFVRAQNLIREFKQFSEKYDLKVIKGEVYAIPFSMNVFVSKYYDKLIYIGKRLGRFDGQFKPSLSFYEELFKYTNSSKIINLPYKKAWLFVCGRDLFRKNLRLSSSNSFYFVTYHDSFIGIVHFDGMHSFLKNIIDIGIYIRNEKEI